MRILFLTPSPPRPDGGGAAIRNWYLIQAARTAGHSVTICTYGAKDQACERDERWRYVAFPPVRTPARRLRDLLAHRQPDLALRLHQRDMSDEIAKELAIASTDRAAYDLIQVEGLEMWANLSTILLDSKNEALAQTFVGAVREPPSAANRNSPRHESERTIVPMQSDTGTLAGRFANRPYETSRTEPLPGPQVPQLIYDAHNAEATLQRRSAAQAFRTFSIPTAAYSLTQWLKLRAYERNAIQQAAATLAVSSRDAAVLERLSGRHVDVVPIGVDTARYSRDAVDLAPPMPFDVVFSGTLDYRANTDAALWLLRSIWPRIRAAKPDATLAIVGRNPTAAMQRYGGKDGIAITGEVPDDRPYMAGAGVYVLPIRFGAGVRVKLLNAMSMGCAVVATNMACEGVDGYTHAHLVATQPHPGAFAAAALALLNDPDRRLRLGRAARALMIERYDWSVVTPALLAVYDRLGARNG